MQHRGSTRMAASIVAMQVPSVSWKARKGRDTLFKHDQTGQYEGGPSTCEGGQAGRRFDRPSNHYSSTPNLMVGIETTLVVDFSKTGPPGSHTAFPKVDDSQPARQYR